MVPKSIVVGRSSSPSWLVTGTAARGVAGRGRHAARARRVRFNRRGSKEPQRAEKRAQKINPGRRNEVARWNDKIVAAASRGGSWLVTTAAAYGVSLARRQNVHGGTDMEVSV